MRYEKFVKICVELFMCSWAVSAWCSFARIQLDDGSSLPITPMFNQIRMLSNEPDRKVVLANSIMSPNTVFLMITDRRSPIKDFRPDEELRRALGQPNLNLISIPEETTNSEVRGRRFLLSEAGPMSGSLVTYGVRRLHHGIVVFFLVDRNSSFQQNESTFWRLVNEFKPPPYTHVPFETINRTLLAIAFLILVINVRLLWNAFKLYAALSPHSSEPIEGGF